MSQAGILNISSSPLPPDVATSYVTDSGTAIPAGNVIYITGGFTDENNNNGIKTVAFPDLEDEIFIDLTNRLRSQTSTDSAAPLPILSYLPTVVGTYNFSLDISAYNTSSMLGATYRVVVGIIYDGANSTKLNLEDIIANEQAGMTACNVNISISTALVILNVIGLPGATINWNVVGTYVFAGA